MNSDAMGVQTCVLMTHKVGDRIRRGTPASIQHINFWAIFSNFTPLKMHINTLIEFGVINSVYWEHLFVYPPKTRSLKLDMFWIQKEVCQVFGFLSLTSNRRAAPWSFHCPLLQEHVNPSLKLWHAAFEDQVQKSKKNLSKHCRNCSLHLNGTLARANFPLVSWRDWDAHLCWCGEAVLSLMSRCNKTSFQPIGLLLRSFLPLFMLLCTVLIREMDWIYYWNKRQS